ncbi:MAG TPA: retroviral-like aspartic protease family protein [Thermoanaerobaculia bacterium]|nr:retroviral-like aspartic protease family protein [Thermoanaerobaculia bacterium]
MNRAPEPIEQTPRIATRYGSAELQDGGAMLSAVWSVPRSLAEQLTAAGRPIPSPVPCAILLDTGANNTCICASVAKRLGLGHLGERKSHTANGEIVSGSYRAQLELCNASTGEPVISVELDVVAARNIAHAYKKVTRNGSPVEVLGLLGRDVLRSTRMLYDGAAGVVVIEFRTEAAE